MTARDLILTADHLTAAGACPEQVALFRQVFPDGAPLTPDALATAREAGLDVGWCVVLLDAPAREAYRRATAPAEEAHYRAIAPALLAGLVATFTRALEGTP